MQLSSLFRALISATLCVAVLVSTAQAVVPATPAETKDAIVKIYTYHDVPDYQNPWSRRGTYSSTGSGCVIKGKRILSNAHVVSDQTFIQVRRYGEAKRYTARVLSVSHAADLALLTVDDPAFFEGITPLELGDLAQAQQEVLVYGFPLGGDTLSITKGVISRIEHQVYAHSSSRFLAVQIDAAINPGNSGGPAIISNQVVGVAMQGISKADNIGYIVPAPVIEHFLEDIGDGNYDGFPSIGIIMQGVENTDLKRKYKMDEDQTGMLITRLIRNAPASEVLKEGDVLLAVAGHPVADDGTVEFRNKERTSVSYYIQEHHVGDDLEITILRDGEETDVTLNLDRSHEKDRIVPMERYDVQPRYFVYGGLVFCPLTINLLHSWGRDWDDKAPVELVAFLDRNYIQDDRDEIVLILKILPADVNQGYQDFDTWVVETVDGTEITTLNQLVELVEQGNGESFITIGNKGGQEIVLDRDKVAAANDEILRTYRIPQDRYLEEE